ncbi:growth arrest and DNA damage-inducible protein GADD45 alpha-like isoform X2 [Ostrea edulis]|uniref:growth arrest and DNA damage-inducible protein GADD45 alpha-like isoform X2 n=1 Tax=Ostrea edulis TaxID=37623 RepID=UPI00209533E4|nr:growth arrest and DNA damage-inducible protein GADD45 alpha-like isoform X2 [Ostrea edulis]
MTITDLLASKMAHKDRCYMTKIGEAVKDVVSMAAIDRRLVLGAMPSAEFLGEEADNVALCLLLENKSDDVLISIQHKLVEAYCWENDIPLLKVDSEDKVRHILASKGEQNNNEPDDLSCILVKNADKMSSSESMLADFFDYIMKNEIEPFPVITLPE